MQGSADSLVKMLAQQVAESWPVMHPPSVSSSLSTPSSNHVSQGVSKYAHGGKPHMLMSDDLAYTSRSVDWSDCFR